MNTRINTRYLTASILDSTSCSLNVRKSMAPRKRRASSNCFSYEYVGDAYNGETVGFFTEELKGGSLFSVKSKLSRTCSGVKWFWFFFSSLLIVTTITTTSRTTR
jgi:hypothetical protein